jgi:protein-S-isoprenylcysteine O-methyltransferase Ste14
VTARRVASVLGSAIFLLVAPGSVAGLVPWWISRWHLEPPFLGAATVAVRAAGVLLIAAGIPMLLDSFARFAWKGLGTPAPVFPTRHLVVGGLYRFVRNPMYVGLIAVIVGQALLFANLHVLEYAAVVWAITHAFVLLYEEPTLRQRFGGEYEAFCANVPRWIPRLRPWRGPT